MENAERECLRLVGSFQQIVDRLGAIERRLERIENALWDDGLAARVYWILGLVAGVGALCGVLASVVVQVLL